jgi:signal peptidase I
VKEADALEAEETKAKSEGKDEAKSESKSEPETEDKDTSKSDETDEEEGKASPTSERKSERVLAKPVVNVAEGGGGMKGLYRSLYWVLWFGVVPFSFGCVLVWALTPASGVEQVGALGWVQSVVREQPVPVGIVLFTLAEMTLWALRFRLPLARYANPPPPDGVPLSMSSAYERARVLTEEADIILKRNGADLTTRDRKKLEEQLEELRTQMNAAPFREEPFLEALSRAEEEVELRLNRWRKSEVREYVESIAVAVGVALSLRAFVVEAFKIPSGSMIPTLQIGDHIFVNKFAYGPAIPWTHSRLWQSMPPERGDVMVFLYPEHTEQDFIKRVIALPGDELRVRSGHPIINGWEVPSCLVGTYSYTETESQLKHEGDLFVEYLGDESYLTLYDRMSFGSAEAQGPYYVKPGEVWVMGDNRNNSHDSRAWWNGQGGGVPFDFIKGRALFVWLSMADTGVDWSRLGAPVMGRPRLPLAMKHLEPAMDKCMRDRPPMDKTTPPPAKAQ